MITSDDRPDDIPVLLSGGYMPPWPATSLPCSRSPPARSWWVTRDRGLTIAAATQVPRNSGQLRPWPIKAFYERHDSNVSPSTRLKNK
jgi:hypothetical protein